MSLFRSAAVGTLIVGAGLGSLAGLASAHESDHAAKGCSNSVEAANKNGADRTLGDTNGGSQTIDPSNLCDIFNGNQIASNNNTAGGNLTNGNTTTENAQSTSTSSITSTLTNALPAA